MHRFSSAIYYIMEKTKTTIRMKTMKTECRADMLQKLTSRKIREIAMWQSAIDLNCAPGDFLMEENRLAISEPDPRARRYLSLPFECNLVSYGSNIVASVSEATRETVKSYIETYPMEHCFETPNLHILNEALSKFDLAVCFMAEYFLPELNSLKMRACKYHLKLLEPPDFQSLYQPQWSHALCEQRKQLDVLGVGAYDKDRLIALAGASADCDSMWQIGIDVLPEYRSRGIGSALTSRLAFEILKRGRVPFYCAAWSNLRSVRNAIRSGFRPAWVEMTAKRKSFVAKINHHPRQQT